MKGTMEIGRHTIKVTALGTAMVLGTFGSLPSVRAAGIPSGLPPAPNSLRALSLAGTAKIHLVWGNMPDLSPALVGFLIERSKGNQGWEPAVSRPIYSHDLTFSGLEPGQQYRFRVKSVNQFGEGNSAETAPVTATGMGSAGASATDGAPPAPNGLGVYNYTGMGRVRLSWGNLPDRSPLLAGFVVDEAGPDGNWVPVVTKPIIDHEIWLSGLVPGGQYRFRVTSVSNTGMGRLVWFDSGVSKHGSGWS